MVLSSNRSIKLCAEARASGRSPSGAGFELSFRPTKCTNARTQWTSHGGMLRPKLYQVCHANTELFLPGLHLSHDRCMAFIFWTRHFIGQRNGPVSSAKVLSLCSETSRPGTSVVEVQSDCGSCQVVATKCWTSEGKAHRNRHMAPYTAFTLLVSKGVSIYLLRTSTHRYRPCTWQSSVEGV